EMTIPDLADGNYRISIKLETADAKADSIAKNATIRIERGIEAKVTAANARDISFDKVDFAAEIKEANVILDALDSMNDPFVTRRGDFRKAYRSRVDNSFQPYRIFVPTSYDSSKRSALIIALHGMGGDENSYFDAYARG